MSYERRVVSLEYRVRTAVAGWLRRVAGRRSFWEFFVLGISVEIDAHRWSVRASRWADRIDFPLARRHGCRQLVQVRVDEMVGRTMADLDRLFVSVSSLWAPRDLLPLDNLE